MIYTFVLYWIAGMIYTSMDLINKPAALKRYKIQPGTNEPVETKRLIQVIFQVIFNQTVVGYPFTLFSYYALQLRGAQKVRELPTFHRFVSQFQVTQKIMLTIMFFFRVLLELAVFLIVEEAAFYYSHRFLHSKRVYKAIHKQV